jgi:hypothetical protein
MFLLKYTIVFCSLSVCVDSYFVYLIVGDNLNSIHVMAVNKQQAFGVIFLKGHISLKMGPIAPFLATIQPFSSARAFLLS